MYLAVEQYLKLKSTTTNRESRTWRRTDFIAIGSVDHGIICRIRSRRRNKTLALPGRGEGARGGKGIGKVELGKRKAEI